MAWHPCSSRCVTAAFAPSRLGVITVSSTGSGVQSSSSTVGRFMLRRLISEASMPVALRMMPSQIWFEMLPTASLTLLVFNPVCSTSAWYPWRSITVTAVAANLE